MPRWSSYAAVAVLAVAPATPPRPPALDTVTPNDNRHAAGTLEKGVLTVALEARAGTWMPEGDKGRTVDVAAFAEEGKALSTPGPLIRVPVGTEIRATVRNRLDKPLIVYGFGQTRGLSDSVIVPVNSATPLSFRATAPGTYYYVAKRGVDIVGGRPSEDTQLHGVIVVDAPNVQPDSTDRVMAVSWWCNVNPASRTGLSRCTMTINGLSWPHTEHLQYTQGDSIRWRVVNFTELDHPMHLHGFYFRVDSRGNGVTDSVYSAAQRRMGVTEVVSPFTTMSLAWRAERPGNWIYHCHYAVHLSGLVALDTEDGGLDTTMLAHHETADRPHQMFGLVMGISIAPKGAQPSMDGPARAIRILQREKPNVYGTQPGMSFVLDGTPDAANPDALPVPGPTLVLERGKRVAVTIVNQSDDHAAVHWHGIELESYPDGVPGWSGSGKNVLPAIAPRDSLTVRWTPPRTGSFMYHSHFAESKQMGSGLYGPIIVVEPGQKFDPETDRILFFGTAGSLTNVVFGPFNPFVMNGKTQPDAMNLRAGTKYRFRLFNLAGDSPLMVSMNVGDAPIRWRAVAKDGYPLPPSQATSRPATLTFEPGEIYDFEVTPASAGELMLKFGLPPLPPLPPGAPPPPPAPAIVTVPIHVR